MTDDILELIAEGAKWLAIGSGAYFSALIGLPATGFFGNKIKTKKELEHIIYFETKKLKIKQKIRGHHLGDENDACVKHYKNHEPNVLNTIFIGGKYARRPFVKHELYHIKKQHWKKPQNSLLNSLDYLFRREPQAIIYEVFGLKL